MTQWERIKADPEKHRKYLEEKRLYERGKRRHRHRGKNHYLRYRHKITLRQVEALLLDQDGRCAVCRTKEPRGYGWCVDHDHRCCSGKRSCGKCIRGILCHDCNVLLGFAGDSSTRLIQAAEYLERRSLK